MKRPLIWDVSLSELQALYDMGFTYKEIAKQLNVSTATVCKYLKGYKREAENETDNPRKPRQ